MDSHTLVIIINYALINSLVIAVFAELSGLYLKNSVPSLSSMHSSSNSSITTTGMELNGSSILQKLCENLCTQRNPDGNRKHQSKCCFYQLEQQQQHQHQQQQQNRLMFIKSHPYSMNQNSNHQTDPNDSTYLLMTSTLANRKGMNNSMDCIDENQIFSTYCAPPALLPNYIIDDQQQHHESQINKTITTSSGLGHSTNQTEIDNIHLPIIIITSNTDYQNMHSLTTVSSTISHTALTTSGRSSCCKQTGCMYKLQLSYQRSNQQSFIYLASWDLWIDFIIIYFIGIDIDLFCSIYYYSLSI